MIEVRQLTLIFRICKKRPGFLGGNWHWCSQIVFQGIRYAALSFMPASKVASFMPLAAASWQR